MADKPVKQNVYLKFYNTSDVYVGTLQNMVNDLLLVQEINTPVAQAQVQLQMSPVNQYENSYVAHYNRVDIWVNTKSSPSGVRKFTGYIDSYEQDFDNDTMTLNILSYGKFLNTSVYESGSNTTITHSYVDLAVILKAALDNHVAQGGKISYTSLTIPTTGITVYYTFNTATILEVIEKCHEIAGDTFYWYIDTATNRLVFKQYSLASIDHNLGIGKSVVGLASDKSIINAANAVYFTGGDTGAGVNLYKKFTSATNKALQGNLPFSERMQDERVTTDATATALAEPKLDLGAWPTVTDEIIVATDYNNVDGYPIETIDLGETIYVGNLEGRGLAKWDYAVWDRDKWDYSLSDIGTRLDAIRYVEYTPETVKVLRGRLRQNPEGITRENGRDIIKYYTKDNPVAPS